MSAQQPIQQQDSEKIVEAVKPSNRVYCRWEVTDDTLKELFGSYGKVTEARVVRGPRLRAYGFVTFETEGDASKAIAALNGKGLASPMVLEYAASERTPRVRQSRQPRQPAAAVAQPQTGEGVPVPAQGAPAAPKPRRQRGPKVVPQQQGAPLAAQPQQVSGAPAAEGAPKPRRRRNRRAAAEKDPNWGKVVSLIPDPIRLPLPSDAKITELVAGARQYRPGYPNGKVISSLILNADPNKGPFNCDFRLGDFDLKLLQVKVNSKPNDCRITARIQHTQTMRSREVYLRVRAGQETRHKFFELSKHDAPVAGDLTEVFFVGVDSIQLDVITGLWKKIVLSLVSAMVPKRVPRAFAAGDAAPVAATVPATVPPTN